MAVGYDAVRDSLPPRYFAPALRLLAPSRATSNQGSGNGKTEDTQLAGALSSFAVVAVIAIALPAHAAYPPEGGSSLPDVNMEAVLLAAQLDPPKSGTGITPGSKESVARVERALVRKGLLAKRYVNGHYGSSTRSAYSRWQRRLGADTRIGTNGLPGKT